MVLGLIYAICITVFCIVLAGARAGSFHHQVSMYQVETRARVIIVDVVGFEAGKTLQRRSSSLMSRSADRHSGSLGTEHGGLMSWPEHLFSSNHHDGEVPGEQQNNLSARAMQLGIYGSTINLRRLRTRSFLRRWRAKPSHSLSYPSVPSVPKRPMVSVKSEGSNTLRRKFDIHENKPEGNAQEHKELSPDESRARDDSSDDSGCDDEHIVRIDSPSRLSFRQAS